MLSAEHVLAHTPPWVALILAYLIWQGVQSLRQRQLPLWRVLVVPAMFIASGLSRIVGSSSVGSGALLPWAAALVVFMPLAFATGPRLLAVDRRTGEVTRPGSVVPLIRNVLVFILQYTAVVMVGGGMRGSHEAAVAAHVISGATAGYFIGWVIVALRHYFTAPGHAALAPASTVTLSSTSNEQAASASNQRGTV
jgi:uncharacterized membrane protein